MKDEIQKRALTKLKSELDSFGVEYEIIKHPPIKTVEEGLVYLGIGAEDGVSTLVFKADGKFIAVFRRDDNQLDTKKIKKFLKVSNLEFATAEEILSYAGGPKGAAPMLTHLPTYMDETILERGFVYGGSGSYEHDLKIKANDLKKITNAVSADFIKAGVKVRQKDDIKDKREIRRVLSGITPSGAALHLGNYAGAVKPQFDLLEKGVESYYFVADLHALTTIQDKDRLEKCIINNVFDYIALGLDPEKGIYFRQSDVPEHSMLAIVLANYIPFGLANRMHAFKDKLAKGVSREDINMGLFNYPILMAADILLYKPDGVPVGEDQRQHVEFARETARNFNKAHGNVFPVPEPLIKTGAKGRVIGTDGERKMGKSLGNIIGIFDDEEAIRKQIMGSYTDPNRKHANDPGKVEGNPIFIYHDIINDDIDEVDELKKRYREGKVGDVEVKEKLFEAHKRKFTEARKKRKELENDIELARKILKEGAEKARLVAKNTMKEVYEVVGITNKLTL